MNTRLTIFTPTYNRGYILGRLYQSLLNQSVTDFEWIVVDDGSNDDTEEVVQGFINASTLNIRYYRIENGGKHSAINVGVEKAQGELFFIVDSDDWLAPNALKRVLHHSFCIKSDKTFAGVVGLRAFKDGIRIGGENDFGILDCSYTELRFIHKIQGDMAEVFRTDVLKLFVFPKFQNEKFCPEALVWNRIASKYKMRHFYEKIYFCEYLPDGLTAKIAKLRMKSPEASLTYYSELYQLSIPLLQKVKASINYWRFSFCSKRSCSSKTGQIGWRALWLMPLGYLLHIKDCVS